MKKKKSREGDHKITKDDDDEEEEEEEEENKVEFYKLFTFADRYDIAMMIVGTISAIGSGMGMPLMTVIFGQLIRSLGSVDRLHIVPSVTQSNRKSMS
ncbi:hypothetical protein BVC80_9047g46 [Macleaya cordata]|uniref:Uncharacterized protein n=1 Tax=Macleaya cordata TaxID=56857 RepID=A0A200R328_MACCD|nr:hypothetical protein BVC80_9047g46 [Macleaya cordata]